MILKFETETLKTENKEKGKVYIDDGLKAFDNDVQIGDKVFTPETSRQVN